MEFFPSNPKYYGATTYVNSLFNNSEQIKNITDNELYTLLRIDLGGIAAESIFSKNSISNTKKTNKKYI